MAASRPAPRSGGGPGGAGLKREHVDQARAATAMPNDLGRSVKPDTARAQRFSFRLRYGSREDWAEYDVYGAARRNMLFGDIRASL